ncbi:hypothetical protein [Actinomadura viridis]|uniref:Uncharacterized protein n=1 Tax=Actinomadura viridis TaxID=58110 RepID=A0A931DRR8_9ACTN|nr:hypothetical protein [Actinomadura viridis]MBG6092220.1 hypothetical protein [Actinomadura viridis]
MMSTRRKPRVEALTRLNRAQETLRQGASGAAVRIGPAARQTREIAADRLLIARGWSAPRLRRAGTYVEVDLGPRVGSMLSNAAERIEPPQHARRRRKAALTMLAAASAAGIAGTVLTRRGNAQVQPGESSKEGSSAEAGTGGQVRT